jgi:hypothetical protein
MSTARILVSFGLLVLAAVLPARAVAADSTAKDFVTAIYRNYEGKDAKGLPLNSPKIRALISPGLLKLIDDDEKQAARRNEPPTLDGDPFVDAQDWEIPSFEISVTDKAPDKAEAIIEFTNGGTPSSVTLMLVKLNNAWRIDDFVGVDGSLREALGRKK